LTHVPCGVTADALNIKSSACRSSPGLLSLFVRLIIADTAASGVSYSVTFTAGDEKASIDVEHARETQNATCGAHSLKSCELVQLVSGSLLIRFRVARGIVDKPTPVWPRCGHGGTSEAPFSFVAPLGYIPLNRWSWRAMERGICVLGQRKLSPRQLRFQMLWPHDGLVDLRGPDFYADW